MSSESVDETKGSASAAGDANVGASGSGAVSGAASQKKVERCTPQKLGQKKDPQQKPTSEATHDPEGEEKEADGDAGAGADAEPKPKQQRAPSRRRQSRGRGRKGQLGSDTESVTRSDVSAGGGGRRNRQRKQKTPQKEGGGALDGIAEGLPGGELVNGAAVTVQDTDGDAAGQAGNTVGGLTKGLGGSNKGGEEEESKGEQLRLRLEFNLDIEIQLKAKIHGDLTLGLL